jgi:predicted aspartyl protease
MGNAMGEVRVKVTLRNFVDVALAERGSGGVEDVPTSRLDCLVDTGALMMLLPEDEVGKLGLSRGGRVIAGRRGQVLR